ncbi:putative oxidoreductase [Trypoxylus dichotomus]
MLKHLLFSLILNSSVLLCLNVNGNYIQNNYIYHVPLDEDNLVTLDWQIDYNQENLIFEVHLPTNFKWFAIGFSDKGDLFPADYCVLWYNWKSDIHFQDVHADDAGVLLLDEQQDCLNFKIRRDRQTTKFTYQRKFDTCDENDYIVEVSLEDSFIWFMTFSLMEYLF